MAGVIPRHSLVPVTPCHLTGAAVRAHKGGRPRRALPNGVSCHGIPLQRGSKESRMSLFSSVKGICRLLLVYKSI